MKQVHEPLHSYVANPAELYELLQRMQAQALASVGWRLLACLTLLAIWLIDPGTIGKAALCLSVLTGFACAWSIADHTGRNWFMHLLTLHELIRPRYERADMVMADWLRDVEEQGEA